MVPEPHLLSHRNYSDPGKQHSCDVSTITGDKLRQLDILCIEFIGTVSGTTVIV